MAVQGRLFNIINVLGNYNRILNSRLLLCSQQNEGLKTKMKEKLKELDIPEKPKRPLSPYIRFSVEQRDDLKKKFPNLNMIEITKKCANEWQNMSVDLKEKYIASFRTDLDVYTKKIDAYTENLTEEQKAFIKLVNKEKQEDRKKKQLRKRFKDTGKPKRPLGGYMFFVIEKTKEYNKPLKETIQLIKGQWQQMSDAEKEKYIQLGEKDKTRYINEMTNWEAKMIKEGHHELVRSASIIESKPSYLSKHGKKTD